jgi:hypothetical protein
MMTKVIIAKSKIDCEHLLGQFLDESHFDTLINEDTDCYLGSEDEDNIAFKFRKNYFSKQEQDAAYAGLKEAATQSQNRGLAAGPKGEKCGNREWVTEDQIRIFEYIKKEPENAIIKSDFTEEVAAIREKYSNKESTRGLVWLSFKVKEDNFSFDRWLTEIANLSPAERKHEANEIQETYISDTTYANAVYSGIAGWFDRYPRIPYGRATAYTQHSYDKFKLSFPFLQTLDRGFAELLPQRHGAQRAAADKIDPSFLVPGTVFTTITVNKTFRTAAHRDAGDFTNGLSNLLVLSNNGNYTGGYLILPEVRIAVNVRPGDLLLVNNHEYIHGNTPIELQDEVAERVSLVCYLREKMLDLGEDAWESLRYKFVEHRRKNKEHPLQRRLWNGISEGMWESDEWFDFVEQNGGTNLRMGRYDKKREKKSTLEDMFG